jgi:hypothetical protein
MVLAIGPARRGQVLSSGQEAGCGSAGRRYGQDGELDLTNELWRPVFEPLKDVPEFAKLRVDAELHTLTWPNTRPSSLRRLQQLQELFDRIAGLLDDVC